jgi:cobalt-zinc-cadmium efflux system membrane fusion protein
MKTRSASATARSLKKWVISIIAVVVVAIVLVIWRRPAQGDVEATSPATTTTGLVQFRMEQQWLIHMKLALAQEAELPQQIYSTGRVVPVPSNRALVAPPVGGIIDTRPLPQIGQRVARGQLLATVLQTPTAAEAAQIHIENSRVDAERRRLAQAEIEARARLNAAAAEADRAKRLLEVKAYSQRQLETAEADRKAAEAILAGVQEQIRALQTAPTASNYQVTAPISGTVVGLKKSPGEEVHAGEAILEIVALDRVWVEAPIFEKDLGRVKKDIGAIFTTAAYPDKEFQGRLVSIGSVVDEQSRAASAVFEVNNASGDLKLGMQANLRLGVGTKTKVLLVPKESILDNEGKKIVYVLRTGEEFERRDVLVGDEYGGMIAIVSGVKPGERVVTQGAYQLKLQELRPANAGAHTHEV